MGPFLSPMGNLTKEKMATGVSGSLKKERGSAVDFDNHSPYYPDKSKVSAALASPSKPTVDGGGNRTSSPVPIEDKGRDNIANGAVNSVEQNRFIFNTLGHFQSNELNFNFDLNSIFKSNIMAALLAHPNKKVRAILTDEIPLAINVYKNKNNQEPVSYLGKNVTSTPTTLLNCDHKDDRNYTQPHSPPATSSNTTPTGTNISPTFNSHPYIRNISSNDFSPTNFSSISPSTSANSSSIDSSSSKNIRHFDPYHDVLYHESNQLLPFLTRVSHNHLVGNDPLKSKTNQEAALKVTHNDFSLHLLQDLPIFMYYHIYDSVHYHPKTGQYLKNFESNQGQPNTNNANNHKTSIHQISAPNQPQRFSWDCINTRSNEYYLYQMQHPTIFVPHPNHDELLPLLTHLKLHKDFENLPPVLESSLIKALTTIITLPQLFVYFKLFESSLEQDPTLGILWFVLNNVPNPNTVDLSTILLRLNARDRIDNVVVIGSKGNELMKNETQGIGSRNGNVFLAETIKSDIKFPTQYPLPYLNKVHPLLTTNYLHQNILSHAILHRWNGDVLLLLLHSLANLILVPDDFINSGVFPENYEHFCQIFSICPENKPQGKSSLYPHGNNKNYSLTGLFWLFSHSDIYGNTIMNFIEDCCLWHYSPETYIYLKNSYKLYLLFLARFKLKFLSGKNQNATNDKNDSPHFNPYASSCQLPDEVSRWKSFGAKSATTLNEIGVGPAKNTRDKTQNETHSSTSPSSQVTLLKGGTTIENKPLRNVSVEELLVSDHLERERGPENNKVNKPAQNSVVSAPPKKKPHMESRNHDGINPLKQTLSDRKRKLDEEYSKHSSRNWNNRMPRLLRGKEVSKIELTSKLEHKIEQKLSSGLNKLPLRHITHYINPMSISNRHSFTIPSENSYRLKVPCVLPDLSQPHNLTSRVQPTSTIPHPPQVQNGIPAAGPIFIHSYDALLNNTDTVLVKSIFRP
jgi:hypothetical protein